MAGKWRLLGSNAQFVRKPLDAFLREQKRLGVRYADLTLQSPHIYIDSEEHQDLAPVRKTLADAAVSVRCVTPLPYRYSICADKGTMQYEKTLGYYRQCILAAEELGASYLCVTASGACYDVPADRLRGNGADMLRQLADFAKAHQIVLLAGSVLGEESPENASTPVLVSLEEIAQTLQVVGSDHLKAYLDTEVISLRGETISQWFETLGDEIKLIRFTDGNYHGYRVWGEGCLPCGKYLREILQSGFDGDLSLQIPGERYVEAPEAAQEKNLHHVERVLEEVSGHGAY